MPNLLRLLDKTKLKVVVKKSILFLQVIILTGLTASCVNYTSSKADNNLKSSSVELNETPQNYTINTSDEKWEKIGVAYMGIDKNKITLGTSHNIIHIEEYGDLKLTKTEIRDSEVEIQSSETAFIYRPIMGNMGENFTEIHVKNVEITEKGRVFEFNVNSSYYEMKDFEPGEFEITNPEYETNCGTPCWKLIKEVIIPIVLDETMESLREEDKESCTDQAIRACGDSGVGSVSDNFWGCSYSCK